ncbi:MAG: hypothetical protein LBT05_16490 [Planctomycetaceae bacterium]|jgi:hypothetical protein|nr:hypothetical protein [Planctomycetaceae bacterium]
MSRLKRFLAVFVVLFFYGHSNFAAEKAEDDLLSSSQKSLNEYRREAERLARWCEQNGLREQAEITRKFVLPILEEKLYLPILPRHYQKDQIPDDASPNLVYWHDSWNRIRQNLALKLQEQAKLALHENRVILAMQMISIALHASPDSDSLRNALGYKLYENEWRTQWEVDQLKQGKINHEKFGWIPAKYVERYESGERYNNSKWISKEEDDAFHAKIENGWIISSEHYDVQTNHSIEEGVRLSRRLEIFYRVWKQVFIQYLASSSQLAEQWEGKRVLYKEPRLRIVFFKNRRDYLNTLQKDDPKVSMSVGFYDDKMQKCYFYKHDGKTPNAERDMYRTVFHEGTHQLFNCAKKVNPTNQANFWATEAAAIYMETLRREGNYYVLGNPQDIRVLSAKYRFFESKFYIPFGNIVALNARTFQKAPYLPELYSQCGGMAYFLMHYDKGRYRDAFVTYLDAIYLGRDAKSTLFHLTAESPETLDSQYEEMLKKIPYPKNE